jgi:hypothetical protein
VIYDLKAASRTVQTVGFEALAKRLGVDHEDVVGAMPPPDQMAVPPPEDVMAVTEFTEVARKAWTVGVYQGLEAARRAAEGPG